MIFFILLYMFDDFSPVANKKITYLYSVVFKLEHVS